MSADWQVGDLALQIRDLTHRGYTRKAGAMGVVIKVIPDVVWKECIGDALVIDGFKHTAPCGGCWHGNFVKVTPPKADEFDTEVIELLNRKPVEASWQSIARELRLEREGL